MSKHNRPKPRDASFGWHVPQRWCCTFGPAPTLPRRRPREYSEAFGRSTSRRAYMSGGVRMRRVELKLRSGLLACRWADPVSWKSRFRRLVARSHRKKTYAVVGEQVISDPVANLTLQFTVSRTGHLRMRLWGDQIPFGARDFRFDKTGVLTGTGTPVSGDSVDVSENCQWEDIPWRQQTQP